MGSIMDGIKASMRERRLRGRQEQIRDILSRSYQPTPGAELPGPTRTGEPLREQLPGQLNIQSALQQMYQNRLGPEALQLQSDLAKMQSNRAGMTPSAVREHQYWQNLPDQEKEDYLKVKRAQKFLDVGSGFVAPTMVDPTQTRPVAPRQLRPTERPDYVGERVTAQKGAEFEAKKLAGKPKARLALQTAQQRESRVTQAIDRAIPNVSHWTAGLGGAMLQDIPLTEARDLRATIDTIKANMGFDELNAMRQSSPTGGALGQVSERELGFLQSVIANLEQSQSPEQLKENLINAKKEIRESWKRIQEAYQQDYGKKSKLNVDLPPSLPPGSRQIGTSGGIPVYEAPNGRRYILE